MSIATASEIDRLLERLFPLNRNLSGEGNRETLRILKELIPLEITDYPCGTQVFDWTIPDEWYIQDAWIKDSTGKRLVDFAETPLHVVGYSEPVKTLMPFDVLAAHLHVLEDLPEAIPYRTSYYAKNWGFCVTRCQHQALQKTEGQLEVVIDSGFKTDGSMPIGELRIPGDRAEEYLVSTYICHPFMANDNLSGITVAALLAKQLLSNGKPHFSWRFVFVPETIGAIAYLSHNEDNIDSLQAGFLLSCCGGQGPLGYKESFLGDSVVDRAIRMAFRDHAIQPIRYPFSPTGSDERQYSSPGFRIPVATICKDKYHEYPQYHTSLDNLDFVNGAQIRESLDIYESAISILENNRVLKSAVCKGEPQLGRRGLYPETGGSFNQYSKDNVGKVRKYQEIDIISWCLFLADGNHDLVSIAERSGIAFSDLVRVAQVLEQNNLIMLLD